MTTIHDMDERVRRILKAIETGCRAILSDELTGIYVHGSLVLGCFLWEKSDIDFLIVTRDEPTLEQKMALIAALLELDADAPLKGLEMSLLLEKDCKAFVYPTPYYLHFSNMHKQRFRDDLRGYCEGMYGDDPDLAAHITVTRHAGIVLCGKPIADVFSDVPKEAYLDSIRYDIEGALEDIKKDPMYYTLSLCRVLGYVREGLVLSKRSGGEWGLAHLPQAYAPFIEKALRCYTSGAIYPPGEDAEQLQAFAKAALAEIYAK